MRTTTRVDPGDVIEVARSGHAGCDACGAGLVLEVLRDERGVTLRVRWEDGSESYYRPGRRLRVRAGAAR